MHFNPEVYTGEIYVARNQAHFGEPFRTVSVASQRTYPGPIGAIGFQNEDLITQLTVDLPYIDT